MSCLFERVTQPTSDRSMLLGPIFSAADSVTTTVGKTSLSVERAWSLLGVIWITSLLVNWEHS